MQALIEPDSITKSLRLTNNYLLIVDLDGTLVDTDQANLLSYNEAIKNVMKLDLMSLYKNKERLTRQKLYSILPNLKHQEYKKIIEIKNSVYKKHIHTSTINKSILGILDKYHRTNKIVLATNSHKNRANMILEYHKLNKYFDCFLCKEDYTNQKANKYKYVLDYLSVEPTLTIVFENENNEIKKAISFGIPDKNIITLQNNKDKI